MWTRYFSAATINQAAHLLSEAPATTRIIAGGTDLVLEMEKGSHNEISTLVDISRISGLDMIRQSGEHIHVGALVTHNQVIRSGLLQQNAACLVEACSQVGSPQIRNRGTVVGNLITASPANDTIPALIALDASLTLVSANHSRVVKLANFYTGVRRTVMQPDEILSEIAFPVSRNSRSVFYKLALRNAQAISLINVAVWLETDAGVIRSIRIAAGAVAPTIVRLASLESYFYGKPISEILNKQDWPEIPEIRPISDIRSSLEYRREMVKEAVAQSLEKIDQGTQTFSSNPSTLEGKDPQGASIDEQDAVVIDESHPIRTTINGKVFTFAKGYKKSLLHLLRDDAGLTGTKEGCGEGECGACTVYLDGKAVMACLVPAPRAHLAQITTIEGLSNGEELHPVQAAFIEEGAVQCGYCTPGFVMSAAKLLESNPHPSADEIKQGITGNLCRCTGYYKIVKAIEIAADVH